MTWQQTAFLRQITTMYEFVIGEEDPFLEEEIEAGMREDDLELARLGAMKIIAIELGGGISDRLATRWLELFCEEFTGRPAS